MYFALLARQLRSSRQSVSLALWASVVVAVQAAAWLAWRPVTPAAACELLAWTQLLTALVAGGFLTGWRVAQLPKTRTAEFYLVTPCSTAAILGGELAGGMLRTALALAAGAPAVAALCGAGWITVPEAFALTGIPLAFGWLAGTALAVVAYEPPAVRKAVERLVLAALAAYFVIFGLAGSVLAGWVVRHWTSWTNSTVGTLADAPAMMRLFNPFRLLGTLGQTQGPDLAWRVAGVVLMLVLLTALCFARLAMRLRPHYLEENYGRPPARKRFERPPGGNPLSWWTERRVTRFRGNVNLYLAWTVVLMHCAWLFYADDWPAWLGAGVIERIESYGGSALLAAGSLVLAVVGVAFLDGLWDSNLAERLARMELLLVTPLAARHYLAASVVAGWTRGRSYLLAMLVTWIAAALAGRLAWAACLGLCLLSGVHLLLVFAVAFTNFGRMAGDRAAATWGIALSVGAPLAVWALIALGWHRAAACLPLGAVFLFTLPPNAAPAAAQSAGMWLLAAVAGGAWLALAWGLLERGVARFEVSVRAAFARQ